jgi:urease accessory protein
MATGMTTERDLLALLTWLSPAFPVGAYTYSHGLEWAVEDGLVHDRASLEDWLAAVLRHGAGRSDAILLAQAHRLVRAGDDAAWAALRELAAALPASAELALETSAQGTAFARTCLAAWPDTEGCLAGWLATDERGDAPVYPLAVGAAGAAHGIAPLPLASAYLHAFMANLVSAAVRLVPLGQTNGQCAMATLVPVVEAVATTALDATLDDLGSATLMVDWCAMRHETQYTRLFRS